MFVKIEKTLYLELMFYCIYFIYIVTGYCGIKLVVKNSQSENGSPERKRTTRENGSTKELKTGHRSAKNGWAKDCKSQYIGKKCNLHCSSSIYNCLKVVVETDSDKQKNEGRKSESITISNGGG